MKTTLIWTLLLAVTLTAPALAQGPNRTAEEREAQRQEMAQQMADRLELTQEQREQLKPLMEEHHAAMKALRQEAQGNKQAMRQEAKALRQAHHDKVKALLTPEQREEFDTMVAERLENRRQQRANRGRRGRGQYQASPDAEELEKATE